ncbi:MAG: ATP-binding protein [Pseudomonadota bacterium]
MNFDFATPFVGSADSLKLILDLQTLKEDHDIYFRHLKNLDTSKNRQVCELQMEKKDGIHFDVQLETTLIAARCKEPEQYRTVVIDISARKRAEKEKEKIQAKSHRVKKIKSIGTVAGGVAHDFNNILQIILGNVQLVSDEVPKFSPAHVKLKKIMSAALRGADIVKQLIDFSHGKNVKLKLTGIVGIIKEALELLKPSIPATIELKQYYPDTDVTILADPKQITQILTNLCTNASQAMEGTSGQLEIRVETKHLIPADIDHFSDFIPGEYLKITVKDTGPGIHPEIIDQIFDPYFTTKGFGNGSGMGLTVVHSIIKNHNGDISSVPHSIVEHSYKDR